MWRRPALRSQFGIMDEFGLDSGKNTLVGCNDSWTTVDLRMGSRFTSTGKEASVLPPSWPGASGAQAMLDQCRASVRAGIGRDLGAAGKERSQWVRESVARMDQAVASCRDRWSPVAAGWQKTESEALRDYEEAKNRVIEKYPAQQVTAGDVRAVWAYARLADLDALKKMVDQAWIGNFSNRDTLSREAYKAFLLGVLAQLTAEATELIDNPVPPPSPPATPPGSDAAKPVTEPAPAPATATISSCPAGIDCKPACAEIQARWQRFKQRCQQSGWQTYDCEVFLRRSNGCVDPALINPTPDGDMTCPPRARLSTQEKAKLAYVLACEKKRWVMMPSGERDVLCTAPELEGAPVRDLCNDPRVMPAPDQCGGMRQPGDERPTPPGPPQR